MSVTAATSPPASVSDPAVASALRWKKSKQHEDEIDDQKLSDVPFPRDSQGREDRDVDDEAPQNRIDERGKVQSAEVELASSIERFRASALEFVHGAYRPVRALVLEDDVRLRSLVVRTLTRAGLACDEASRIEEADELLSIHEYDLLVLDRRLPDGDGLSVCRAARSGGFSRSILMLTARDDAESTVEGLSDGADDYLGKPFDLEVLAARARALLRRNTERPSVELSLGDLHLQPGRRTADREGKPLSLTAREFTILESLMRRPGGILSREEILEQAWGEREEPMSNTIDVLIGRLRKKIDEPGRPSRIETVRGMGYRLR